MKRWLQAEDKSVMTPVTYKFQYDVDTKGGISLYQQLVPPIDGFKYDTAMKKFVTLKAMELTTAYNAWAADAAKPKPNRKWRYISEWTQYESPADDGFPPWPGPFSV